MKGFANLPIAFAIAATIFSVTFATIDRRVIGYGARRQTGRNSGDMLTGTDDACGNSKEFYFKEALIDNFASAEEAKFWVGDGQRYWINEELFLGEGYPIFVFIGGEGEENCRRLSDGYYFYDLAKEHGAMLVDIEHRFYGESYPTAGMTTDELAYLSSDQALADLARLITYIKESKGLQNSRVITFGGSYPGNLAAWFRLKYPSVTSGSVASSAPLHAKENFFEYMEVVGDALKYFAGSDCYNSMTMAAEYVAQLYSAGGPGSEGWKQLQSDFETCSDMKSDLDLNVLLQDLMGNIQGTVQYNLEVPTKMNVTEICEVMVQPPSTAPSDSITNALLINPSLKQSELSAADAYKNFVKLSALYRQENGMKCEDASWEETIKFLGATEKDHNNAARPWVYQTCNQFGFFQTAASANQPFSSWQAHLDVNFSMAMCEGAFEGWTVEPQTAWTNTEYGATAIAATNVIFPSGTIDPWHALGVTNETAAELPMDSEQPLYILGTAHCADMRAPAASDPASLTAARQVIAETVAAWLK
jgi:hypothetical protein